MTSLQPHTHAAPDLRITEIDVLRGIALIGIYWINIVIFALPHGVYSLPNIMGEAKSANIFAWAFSDLFVEGSMRGLFSMLFGASTLIFLNEAKLTSSDGIKVVERYYRRCLILIAFGLIHAYFLLSMWELLYAYGLLGMFLFPLRNLRGRTLIILGLVLFVISDINSVSQNYTSVIGNTDIRALSGQDLADYQTQTRKETLAELEEDVATYLGSYSDIFTAQSPVVAEQQSTKIYTDHFFDIGGMMLIGMALMKLGVLTVKRPAGVYLLMLLAGYAFGGLLRGMESYELWIADFNTEARDPDLFMPYEIGRIAMTLGHIGLFGLLVKAGAIKRGLKYLAPVGRMALTNYVGQSVISAFIFYGFGLGYFAMLERYQLTWVYLAVIAFQIVASNLWLKQFRMGPLEWLWRSLIYGEAQPLRHLQI